MPQLNNPFVRGYQNLRIVRTLLITYADDCPPIWRPLHSSQAHLPNDHVELFPCIIGKDFALITEGQDVPDDLQSQCADEGIVRTAVYAIAGDDLDGTPLHIGDLYSEEAARDVIHRHRFEYGAYSRCWEVSRAHLSALANRYLDECASAGTPNDVLFVAFRLHNEAIGVKLIATPWMDTSLQSTAGVNANELRQQQLRCGVPETLVHILHLAARADTRILIFDPNAPIREPLLAYD